MKRPWLALGALTILAACSSEAGDKPEAPSAPAVGRHASANPGSVNSYWLPTPRGLVVVDAQRSLTDARSAVADIKATGKPVVAILITHPHPDHVGGIGVLHEAYPQAPIYASKATGDWMRADPLKFYEITRKLPGSDYASRLTYPTRNFAPGEPLDLGGVRVETAEFKSGESETATAYYEPESGSLFAGDLVNDHATPALLEGHSCGWLDNLGRLTGRFPKARTVYPGHGAPGDAVGLIVRQRAYLEDFRRLVQPAVAPGSPGGKNVGAAEQKAIRAELDRRYPGYPSVASLPTLVGENIKAVARELTTTNCPSK